jgi:hypothetical protein
MHMRTHTHTYTLDEVRGSHTLTRTQTHTHARTHAHARTHTCNILCHNILTSTHGADGAGSTVAIGVAPFPPPPAPPAAPKQILHVRAPGPSSLDAVGGILAPAPPVLPLSIRLGRGGTTSTATDAPGAHGGAPTRARPQLGELPSSPPPPPGGCESSGLRSDSSGGRGGVMSPTRSRRRPGSGTAAPTGWPSARPRRLRGGCACRRLLHSLLTSCLQSSSAKALIGTSCSCDCLHS